MTKRLMTMCLGLVLFGATAARADSESESRPRYAYSPLTYAPYSHPFDREISAWAESSWRWLFSIPAAQNPMLHPSGGFCGVNQSGPVYFLAPVADPGGVASFTEACSIPEGKPILVNLSGVLNDFPCPDPTFKPAVGQTLYEFLLAGAQGGPNGINSLSLTVDGAAIGHIFDYRVTSDDLFTFKGDPSLATTLDGCVTGTRQPAVSDTLSSSMGRM